jgi:cytochrome b6-f complex iron-sulfur subunit
MAGQVRDDALQTKHWTWSRRDFFSLAGWAAFLNAVGVLTLGFTRFMFPRVLFEPSTLFSAGFPSEYSPNTVSEKLVKKERAWIAHQVGADGTSRFIAVLTICTHLGCTPRWFPVENKFKCPCHGSGFRGFDYARGRDILAIHFEGPAPRPLERLKVWIGDDGSIRVDRGVKLLWDQNTGWPAESRVEV